MLCVWRGIQKTALLGTVAFIAVIGSAVVATGTASATGITSPDGATPTIKAEAEGHVALDNPIAVIECASSVEGKVESHGEGVTASGNISALSFTGCTNSWHVTVVSAGSLEIHHIGGGSDGTVTSSGATVESTRFGVTCRYATNSTHIGALTGSNTTGGNATLDVEAAIPFHSGSGLCGSSATTWTGSYAVTSPVTMNVDAGNGGAEAAPGISVSPDTWNYLVNNATHTFTIENKGGTDIKDLAISYTTPFFKPTGHNCAAELKSGKKCEITLERNVVAAETGVLIAESKAQKAQGSAQLHAK